MKSKSLKSIIKSLNVPENYEIHYSKLLMANNPQFKSNMIVMEEIDGVAVEFFLAVEDDQNFMDCPENVKNWICSSNCKVNSSFSVFKRVR